MSVRDRSARRDSVRSDDPVVVIEAGGTYLRAAVAHPSGPGPALRELTPSRTATDRDPDLVLSRTVEAVVRLGLAACSGRCPARAVVAWPGPLSPEGAVYASPTVAGPTGGGTAVTSMLSAGWGGAAVLLVNDLTAAGLRFVADGYSDFAVVTVGSGIGHKVFAGGRPVVGPRGRGGELGHLVVREGPGAEPCDCGGVGHLGALASGRAIVRRVAAARQVVDGYDDAAAGRAVVSAVAAGDPVAIEVVADAAALLGRALAGLHVGVGVERFLLIGGFACAAGEGYRRQVVAAGRTSCWDLGLDWDAAISIEGTGDDVALGGAWLAARDQGWV